VKENKTEQEKLAERERRYKEYDRRWARQIATYAGGMRIDCTPPHILRLAAEYKREDAEWLEGWAKRNEEAQPEW